MMVIQQNVLFLLQSSLLFFSQRSRSRFQENYKSHILLTGHGLGWMTAVWWHGETEGSSYNDFPAKFKAASDHSLEERRIEKHSFGSAKATLQLLSLFCPLAASSWNEPSLCTVSKGGGSWDGCRDDILSLDSFISMTICYDNGNEHPDTLHVSSHKAIGNCDWFIQLLWWSGTLTSLA